MTIERMKQLEAEVAKEASADIWQALREVAEKLETGRSLIAPLDGRHPEPLVLYVLLLVGNLQGELAKRMAREES